MAQNLILVGIVTNDLYAAVKIVKSMYQSYANESSKVYLDPSAISTVHYSCFPIVSFIPNSLLGFEVIQFG